ASIGPRTESNTRYASHMLQTQPTPATAPPIATPIGPGPPTIDVTASAMSMRIGPSAAHTTDTVTRLNPGARYHGRVHRMLTSFARSHTCPHSGHDTTGPRNPR